MRYAVLGASLIVTLAGMRMDGVFAQSSTQGLRPRPPAAPADGTAVPRNGTVTPPPPTVDPGTTPAYGVRPPEGYLPWPQHNPSFSQAEYDAMMNNVFILNNFALYQAANDSRTSMYLHNGLDIVLANGTPIYAVAPGVVRGTTGTGPSYLSLIVEDEGRPGWAWIYTHVQPDSTMRPGTRVHQGTRVATVSFEGIQHVHLTRTFLAPGGAWLDTYAENDVDPTPFFFYEDTEAPSIETPFYYFLNESTRMLPRGSPTLVSGAIDIVAGVRDGGKYAKGRVPGWPANVIYGDRNAPKRISISIASAEEPQRVLWSQVALDLSNIYLNLRRGFGLQDPDRVSTVYAYRPETNPDYPRDNNASFSYFYLTNRSRASGLMNIEVTDGQPAWDTAAVDASGRPLFHDGEYVITVTASDWKGNTRSAQDRVVVLNRR